MNNKPKISKTMQRLLAALCTMLIATIVIAFSSASADTSSQQPTNVAGPETQFNVSIAYAYVGERPSNANASYVGSNGALMFPVSQYPSAVILNVTRLPGAQIASCDAEIEVYNIQITTITGLVENNCYFVGTNYNPSFSSSEPSRLIAQLKDLITSKDYSGFIGNFEFNWTDSTSILSNLVGSANCYSTLHSSLGLWSAGNPESISVAVYRIGYIKMSNDSVVVYNEQPNSNAVDVKQLNTYGNGLVYNNLVPADKLPQVDLFSPIP